MGCLNEKAGAVFCTRQGGFERRTTPLREFAEQVCRRLEWLEKPDRLLLEMIYEQGFSIRKIAGILRRNPSTVSRRVHSLLDGLFSSDYQICLCLRRELTPLEMSIARQRFVLKKSQRAMAASHSISLYALRRHLKKLAAVIEKHRTFGTPAGTPAGGRGA